MPFRSPRVQKEAGCVPVGGAERSPPSLGFSVPALKRTASGGGWRFGAPLPSSAREATRILIVLNGFPPMSSVVLPIQQVLAQFTGKKAEARKGSSLLKPNG